ncbi:MAG: hypothetical protein U1F36_07200 [Planctomycetota bacterium]
MTSKLAFGLLAATLAAPFLVAQDPKAILTAAETKKLQGLVRDWFEPWNEWNESREDKNARKLQKKAEDAKDKFQKEWDARSKKSDLLASMPDLRAVFAQPFTSPRVSGSGILKVVRETPEMGGHAVFIPREYKSDGVPMRVIWELPGTKGGKWQSAKEYFTETWEGSLSNKDSLFIVSEFPEGMDADPLPDPSLPNPEDVEKKRVRQIFMPFGFEAKQLNYDRDRIYLDCGRESSAFGLRFACYFPQRFAGIVLRHPVEVPKDIRLGSLTGVPVLLISSEETKAACDAIAAALNQLDPGKATILEGKGAYPFKDSQPEIETWIASQVRNVVRTRVLVEPNSDSFKRAHWVAIDQAERLTGLPADKRPRLLVEADRSTNRIKVEARGVEAFTLLLNDDLIDLSKEFTVDINGKLSTEKRERNLTLMVEQIMRNSDPAWIFTQSYTAKVPKEGK